MKGYKALKKLNFLIQENLDLVFPNLTVALRVFLTMPQTVASAERSSSKLKLIKTYLRSSMSNDRLTQLAVISIENSVARSISFDAILDKWECKGTTCNNLVVTLLHEYKLLFNCHNFVFPERRFSSIGRAPAPCTDS